MKRPSALVLLVLFFLAPGLSAQLERGKPRAWEHESSDIPVDPRIHFGHLENGMRYAWMTNPEPDQRSYLRLHVNVGSLAETEDERGMAHFLEHMAFNGSRSFPAGTLIEWFQKHGMSFGADTNAVTSFGETIYMIDLPHSDDKSLEEGLTVLRDYVDGLLLEDKEIGAEKGVIDGEMRERDSAQYRVLIKTLEKRYDGTLYPSRLPIGVKTARDRFNGKSVRAFYSKWYRPENLTLVLVGDLEDRDPTPLFEKMFKDVTVPASDPAVEPEAGKPTLKTPHFFISESEIPVVQISVARLLPFEDEAATIENWLEDLPLSYARSMVNLRFSERAKDEDSPFISAGVGSPTQLDVFEGENLSVTSKPERWEEGLAFCEQELRKAIEFGFQQAELDEVRADALRSLDEAVEREKTLSSQSFLGQIVSASEDRVVPTNAETRRKVLRPAIEKLTLEECHKALQKAWSEGTLSVTGIGNAELGEDGGAVLLAAYEKSRKVKVEPPKDIVTSVFAYASNPEKKGKIASRTRIEDLDTHLVRFENGVLLNVKKTDFKEKQILIQCRFGEGTLTMDRERPELAFLANRVFNQIGLEAHSEDDLRRLTAGRVTSVGFSTGEDAFVLGGATTSSDLLLQLELMCAYLTHPGWRDEGLRQFKKIVPQIFQSLEHQHQGPLLRFFLKELYGDDKRFGFPEQEALEAVQIADIKTWLAPHLLGTPLEVTVLGDLGVDQTIDEVARTFGTLPRRGPATDTTEARKGPTIVAGLDSSYEIQTQVPKTLVVIIFPATDGIEAERRRRLSFLGEVVNDRLRIEIREKLGAAYSPGASASASTVFTGMGTLTIQAMSDPDKVETLREGCLAVAESLANSGVTQEEVDRLREPALSGIRDAKRQNGFWMQALSEAQSRPASLDEVRSLEDDYRKMTAKDLSELATKYLPRKRASVLVVSPKGQG